MSKAQGRICRCVAFAFLLFAVSAHAQSDGAWNVNADGNWGDSGNWTGTTIADGVNATADFTQVNISVNRTVTLDSSRTIGHLKFADAGNDGSNTKNWTLDHASNVLTMDTGGAGTPTIRFSAWTVNSANAFYVDVILAGTEGLEFRMLGSPFVTKRPVYLRKANTYTGDTVISNGTWVVAANDDAFSSGKVTINDGGFAALHNNVIVTNDFDVEDGAFLGVNPDISYDADVKLTNSTITLMGGTGTIVGSDAVLRIYSTITEDQAGTALHLGSAAYGSYGEEILIYAASTYTGPTIITNNVLPYSADNGAWVMLYHSNGFGTAASMITVDGTSGNGDEAKLYLVDAPNGLNKNKSVTVNPGGQLYHARGVTLTNTLYLNGGMYALSTSGSGDRYHIGSIVLGAGTETDCNRYGYNTWFQTGVISGDGGLYLRGQDNNDGTFRFRGANTYTGGTRLGTQGREDRNYVGNDTAFGTGQVLMQGATPSGQMLRLESSLTMPNEFAGVGRIVTDSYVLTITGGVSPGDAGVITNMQVEDLDFRGTYKFDYDTDGGDVSDTDSDLVATDTLAFGDTGGTAAIEVSWLGGGDPGTGDYTLFTYTGTDPVISSTWTTSMPTGYRGAVSVDGANDKVILTITVAPPAGTTIRIR